MVFLADVVDLHLSSVDKKITPGEKKVRLCNYSDVYNNNVLRSDMNYMEGTATEREVRNCKLEVGDVVITKDSETPDDIGVPAVVREKVADLICGYHLAILRPLKSELDGEYLHYALRTSKAKRQFQRYANGITRFGLRAGDIARVEIPLPPRPEQRMIAAILTSVDDAIEKTQAVIDQVQVVKRGLMQELLTRGLPGRHTRFKQTEIGELPEEWEVCQLSDLCHRTFVGIAQAATHAYAAQGVPIIRTTNVRENSLDMDNLLCITEEFAGEMKAKTLCAGDVLTARTGYPGTSVVVPESLAGGQCFTLLVSRPGRLLRSRFLCHLMNSNIGSRIVNRGQAGGAQQNLNVSVFKRAQLGVPSVEEQDAICSVLDACYAVVNREENRQEALCAIKTSLMSVLLTGELPVTPDTQSP